MSAIGIDPSLAATGVATETGARTIVTAAGDPERLLQIHTAVRLCLTESSCDLAIVEDLPTHAHGAGLTGMAQGVIRLALIQAGVDYLTVPAATLKKYATGKGNATKADMRMAWYQRAGGDVRDDNQVDALWLREIGLALLGDPSVIEVPKVNRDALTKITPLGRAS